MNQLPAHGDVQKLVETAVHHYFGYRAKLNRFEFRRLLKQGRTSLIIGLGFLAVCLLTGQLVRQQPGTWPIVDRYSGKLDYRWLGRDVATHANFPVRVVACLARGPFV